MVTADDDGIKNHPVRESQHSGSHVKLRKPLPEKQFQIRDSLLTELLKSKEMQTAHNIVIALFVHFAICGVISDLIETGSVNLGFSNILNSFGKPGTAFACLAILHLIPILLLYPTFYLWSHIRVSGYFAKFNKILDLVFYLAVACIIGVTYYIPVYIHFFCDTLPFASAAAVAVEKIRISMKMYAFTRTNVPRVQAFKKGAKRPTAQDQNQNIQNSKNTGMEEAEETAPKNGLRNRKPGATKLMTELEKPIKSENELNFKPKDQGVPEQDLPNFDEGRFCPGVKTYLYYLYAPTFIYRDHYPRSPTRRWSFIFAHLGHFFGSIIFYNLIHHRFGYVLIQDFGPQNHMTAKDMMNILFWQFFVGFSACMLGWLIMLHTVQNIFAELLRFGDRGFYKDWWNCTSMSQYHRTWNTPVQDFLYHYVYKEARDHGIGNQMKWVPALLVFLVSNLFHEYASMFILQFFFPVMGVMFAGPGTFLTFIPNRKFPKLGNIFMHWSFGLGHAFMHMFYTMEYFARVNGCPPAETPLKDFFVPRFATCGVISWK